ncbi:MAG: glycosyltransferase [Clostridia bacterium]|nr:glycosyltransferase [Clostridia bacterium]
MKIVQINAIYNISSTGRTSAELHNYLLSAGHESYVVYSKTDVDNIENAYSMGSPIDIKVHGLLSRISGKQGYFSVSSTKKLLGFLDEIKPDVVHLRNLHGNYINVPMLLRYLAKKDIATVITLHDFWFITGKCVHFVDSGCNKWQSECGNCPNLQSGNPTWFFDCTKSMHKDKIKLFADIPRLAITGVSDWVANEAKKSPIAKNAMVRSIYNWIDFNNFYPRNTDLLRQEKGLQNDFVVLGVSSGWKEDRLNNLIALANAKKDCTFILAGNIPSDAKLPENVNAIGTISSVDELAQYYSLADAFVTFSTAETFGKVSAESMCCGTPVVCHNKTACPEILGENCGYSVDVNDIDAVADAIEKIRENGKAYYYESCVNHAHKSFNRDVLINEYIDLYSELCENKAKKSEKNVAFIGSLYPENSFEELSKKYNIQSAIPADILQKNIVKGLENNLNKHVTVFTCYALNGSFKDFSMSQGYEWQGDKGGTNYCLPFRKTRVWSMFSKLFSVKKNVGKWLKINGKDKKTDVVVYSAYFPFLIPLISLKKKFDINVSLVITDLPKYMGLNEKKSFYNKMSLKFSQWLFEKSFSVVDSLVLLTEQMSDALPSKKPYTVVEGIASESYNYKNISVDESKKRVLYSGTMQKKYGVPVLLNAIKYIKDADAEFVFYGNGDAVEDILKIAETDARIKWCKFLDTESLHEEQQKATVLVNPRQNNEEFTKYSFPSKNLEYMLSGRPTICNMLDGMPQEYKEYLIVPENDSAEALAEAIKNIFNKTIEEQSKIGMKSRNFVLENKNYLVQTQKIIDLLNR